MGLGQPLLGTTAIKGIDEEEDGEQSEGDGNANQTLEGEFRLLFSNLRFFLLRLVDDGQLCSVVFLLVVVDGVDVLSYLLGNSQGLYIR